jgi:hypothetical protein
MSDPVELPLYKDVDAVRFGSRDGDNSIAVYRKLP